MKKSNAHFTTTDAELISQSATQVISKLDTYLWEIDFLGENYFCSNKAFSLITESELIVTKLRNGLARGTAELFKEHLIKCFHYQSKIDKIEKKTYQVKNALRRFDPKNFGNVVFI